MGRAVRTQSSLRSVDRVALATLEEAVSEARELGDTSPTFAVIAACLAELGGALPEQPSQRIDLQQAREEWLLRLRSSGRSQSCLAAYRIALADLFTYLERFGAGADIPVEMTMVAYLDEYRRRKQPADATYYRRFTLLRHFFRWLSRRSGSRDAFLKMTGDTALATHAVEALIESARIEEEAA
jgi:Phage integrase, N-terminal SAM-like domain